MIFQRIFTWMANEIITKKLANSTTFQRFAQATHEKVSKVQAVKPKPQPTRVSYNPYRISEYPTEPVDGRIGEKLSTFTSAFKSNIQKELGKQINKKINKSLFK